MWRYFGRIERAERAAGAVDPISPGLGFLLYLIALILLPFELVYAQGHLNRLWRQRQAAVARAAG